MIRPDAALLRSYQPTDLDAVIAVFLDAIRLVAARDYDRAQIDAWAQVDRPAWQRRRASRPTWVAVRGDAVVGFTDLEDDGHLDMLFVHSACQRMGIASLLVAQVEAAAVGRGLARVFTEASLTARPFFEGRGFRLVARQEVTIRGQTLTNFRMEKMLG